MRQVTISFRTHAVVSLGLWLVGLGVLLAAVVGDHRSLGQLGLGLCLAALMLSIRYLLERQAELLRGAFDRGVEVGRRENGHNGDEPPRITRIR